MSDQRLLVTTSLHQTLDKSKKILFLGEWCKPFSSGDELRGLNSITIPYHWDDRKKLLKDFIYLETVYEKLLIFCSQKLNSIHGTQFSVDYWRIVIGPWLGQFSQIIFDRWFCINAAETEFSIDQTIIVDFQEYFFVPDNHEHFSLMGWSQEWNHYLMSSIIEFQGKIRFKKIKYSLKLDKNSIKQNFIEQKPSFLRRIFSFITHFSNIFSNNGYVFFLNTYLPTWKELFLQIYMLQMPRLFSTLSFKHSQFNPLMRNWTIEDSDLDDFEKCLYSMITSNIPLSYLEDFKDLAELPQRNGWPKKPSLIWTSNSYSSDDIFKIWAAEQNNSGIPIVIGQHGGGIGTHLFAFYEQHQIQISESYLSWGWEDSSFSNIKPIGILKTPKRRKANHYGEEKIMMVTCALQQQSYHLFSSFISSQYIDYLEDQFKFVYTLRSDLKKSLVVRANEKALKGGWETDLRWKDRFKNISINFGDQPISKALQNTRVCVATYNATVFLETLSMNIPTIMFWNPEHWEIRETAQPFYSNLKKANILFDSPESAAKHLNTIWDDIEGWWESENVITARKSFTRNFCYQNPFMIKDLKNHFNDIKI